jgi:hypothetical protein
MWTSYRAMNCAPTGYLSLNGFLGLIVWIPACAGMTG